MLVLSRKESESLHIGDDIKITIVGIENDKVRVGIEAPKSLRIYREELRVETQEANRMAVQSAFSSAAAENFLKGKSDK
jgi:carbon storage regulator